MHDPLAQDNRTDPQLPLKEKGSQRKELIRALTATLFFGAAGGIVTSILNNYLADVHLLDAEGRGWLEFPRELPGFLIMFVAGGLLTLMRETKMAALAMFFTALGGVGLGWLSPTTALMVAWVATWSMGDHIIFAVEGPIGLKLAKKGGEGRRLGHFGGARNLGTITGVGVIYLLSKWIGPRYEVFFTVMAGAAVIAGVLYSTLKIGKGEKRSRRIVFKKKYGIFYAISALFGIRKQIFLVFGSWVLVSLHDVPVSTIALLYFIAATLGVFLRPLLGDVIDWVGERVVLAADEILLLVICLTYAFATDIFPQHVALYVLFGAYIFDNLLFALRIARTTYLKKIADDPADITPTISMGITIDHAVAMSLPVLSGYIWEAWGFRYVFLIAGAIAIVGFFVCLQIKVPNEETATV
ncbi:MFS transporter [bacterium]|nr:MFS transporter [bacterium]